MFQRFLNFAFGELKPISDREDFVRANRLVALATFLIGIIVCFYFISMFEYVDTADLEIVSLFWVLSGVVTVGASVFALWKNFSYQSLPYVLLGALIIADVLLYAVMGYTILNLFFVTIIMSARYHNIVIMRRAMVASLAGYALGIVLGFHLELACPAISSWHDMLGLDYSESKFYLIEQVVQLGALLIACVVCYGMTVSGVGLAKGNAEQFRSRAQMAAAGDIQHQLLPQSFELEENSSFDLYAQVIPIFEASGDYCDYVCNENFCMFVMADVSDKGLPAAMFAMRSQSLLRAFLLAEGFPKGVQSANNTLCESNDLCMFVTAIVGELNMKTGHVRYINAGHEPLAIVRDGVVELAVPEKADFVLGIFEDVDFRVREFDLDDNCALVAFTDGVTDAAREDGVTYGYDRLVSYLEGCTAIDAQEICEGLLADIRAYCGTASQFDDISVLALCRKDKS